MKIFKDTLDLLDDTISVAKHQEELFPEDMLIAVGGDAFVVFHLKKVREKILEIQSMAEKGDFKCLP